MSSTSEPMAHRLTTGDVGGRPDARSGTAAWRLTDSALNKARNLQLGAGSVADPNVSSGSVQRGATLMSIPVTTGNVRTNEAAALHVREIEMGCVPV